jgi:DNA polymerase III subunit delta
VSEALDSALEDIAAKRVSNFYLLHGEEFLVRKASAALQDALVPNASMGLNLVIMDGATQREIVSELSTVSMFGGRKLVIVRDPEFLAPKKSSKGDGLHRAREAWKNNKRKESARRMLAIIARAGWNVGALDLKNPSAPKPDDWDSELGISIADGDTQFLKEVHDFCVQENMQAASNDESILAEWLQKKPNADDILLIATTDLETKHPLVKLVKEVAVFLEFKAASKLKDLDISEFVTETLAPYKKKLSAPALESLKDKVGGNFRLLQSELQKLALYTDGDTITPKDVALLVGHSREEEFFELTEAIQKRSFENAMKYLSEAQGQGKHPLMLLGSVASNVRTLLNSVERVNQLAQGKPPKNYNDFQARLWPKIEAELKEKKAKIPHPYATFMGMQSALNFGRTELLNALVACAEADLALKFGGDMKVIERLIFTLCARMPAWDSGLHTIRREKER